MKKQERGITLVALILTIIVLVILAAVSVAVVTNSGIIGTAINGTQNYAGAAGEEKGALNNAETLMDTTLEKIEMQKLIAEWKAGGEEQTLAEFLTEEGYTVIGADDANETTIEVKSNDSNYTIIISKADNSIVDILSNTKAVAVIYNQNPIAPGGELTAEFKFGEEVNVNASRYAFSTNANLAESAITEEIPANKKVQSGAGTGIDITNRGNYYMYLKVVYTDGTASEVKSFPLKVGIDVASIELDKSELALYLTGTTSGTINATISPNNATNKTVNWTVVPTGVVTLSAESTEASLNNEELKTSITVTKASGAEVGDTASITAEIDGKTATCSVSINSLPAWTYDGIEYSWTDIAAMADVIAGRANSETNAITSSSATAPITYNNKSVTLSVGDTMTIYGTSNYTVRILGFNHDSIATDDNGTAGTAKAGISFEFVTFLESNKMNSSNTTSGGWGASYMRNNVLAAAKVTQIEGWMGVATNTIKKVSKETYKYETSAKAYTSDKLWLLSENEVQGSKTYAVGNEGTQYKYYVGTNNSVKVKNSDYWWLRSPLYNNDSRFCIVSLDGSANAIAASSSVGVAPGFCL